MMNYKFEDFNLGDGVFHKSNKKLEMVVIKKDDFTKNIYCRWIDASGNKLEEDFLFAELIKSDDYRKSQMPRMGTINI